MFEATQYLVSSKKLEDGFCMDRTIDFRLLIDVLRDPRAFHE